MSKVCEYGIFILPEEAIEQFENPIGRERSFLKIKPNTFLGIEEELRIRPRAAEFVKNKKRAFKTYAVVYDNGEVRECLFVFKFVKYVDGSGYFAELTRCIGKRATKKRRITVKDIILENLGSIIEFEGIECLHVFQPE